MKKDVFFKTLGIALLSVLIVFAAGVGITYVSGRGLVAERLMTETELAAALIEQDTDLDKLQNFHHQSTCRISVISLEGEVLYDTDTPLSLENHLGREEVVAALSFRPKTVERYSDTFHCNMTYYAIRTPLGEGEVILRLAVKSAQVNSYILSSLPFLFGALLLSECVAFIFAKRLSAEAAGRITDIAKRIGSVNCGNYTPLPPPMSDSEFYAVYDQLNNLNSKTAAHIRSEQSEREKLHAVLSHISQGILALSADDRLVFANRSALSLFGGGDVVGCELVFLIDDTALIEKILTAGHGGDACFFAAFGETALQVEVITKKDQQLGDEISYIVILSDVTAQKELAKQKEDFFANASHELKTPLTAIMGLTELSLARTEEETTKKQLEHIHKECLRLSGLISDMLKLSHLETQKDKEQLLPIKVEQMAADVLLELDEAIREKNIATKITGTLSLVIGEKKLYALLQNLLSNAVHYNSPGGSIAITLEQVDKECFIRVRDTGIGIAKEHIPHLCERFYRVDKSRSKKTGGTGLGLAIVKHICALYDAKLSIQSEVGIGSEFSICFPKHMISSQ